MSYSKAMNSTHVLLEMSTLTWSVLLADLRERGQGRRESGAFLLGNVSGSLKHVTRWVAYDELDPDALQGDYVRLDTPAFSRLWDICSSNSLEVVADIHTHPASPAQSPIDRANPMIARAGHIALIVPRFAQGRIEVSDITVNVYQGGGRWVCSKGQEAARAVWLKETST